MPSNEEQRQLKLVIGDRLTEYCARYGKCASGFLVSRFIDVNPAGLLPWFN